MAANEQNAGATRRTGPLLPATPLIALMLMAVAMQLSHQTWHTLINNFAIDRAAFTGREIGILQSVREIPGFLAFGAVLLLVFVREQSLALLSLLVLAVGVMVTGFFPSAFGLYVTTLIMSVGFHYYETMNQSLALQWFAKKQAAENMGRVLAAQSFAALAAYGAIYACWTWLGLEYSSVYLLAGGATLVIIVYVWLAFPRFEQKVVQRKELVLRKRYWLYYALTFMGGARRQIFIVFAGFMMVEKFGFSVAEITLLFLANHLFNMALAPKIGRLIGQVGDRKALLMEYGGLSLVFAAYAFVSNPWIAAGLYFADHAFFALSIAMKTYFQKIADPADIAPTAGVAFSINHIAAVVLPAVLGLVWLSSPAAVFLLGAAMAMISFALSLLVPAHPQPGRELVWSAPITVPKNRRA